MTIDTSGTSQPVASDFFATTHWAVVQAAGSGSAQAAQALEQLCHSYWYPLYAYVRRQGYSKEDAEDLTQAFFARFLARNYLKNLNSDKGKFRAVLLASIKHFLANEWDRSSRQKRGSGLAPLSLDWSDADLQYQAALADHLTPDKLYDRAWAMILLGRVLGRLREENANNLQAFECLKPFLTSGKGEIAYAQPAAALQLTEGAVRVAVHRLRVRYRELLREEIRQTLSNPAALEEEMRSLFAAFH